MLQQRRLFTSPLTCLPGLQIEAVKLFKVKWEPSPRPTDWQLAPLPCISALAKAVLPTVVMRPGSFRG